MLSNVIVGDFFVATEWVGMGSLIHGSYIPVMQTPAIQDHDAAKAAAADGQKEGTICPVSWRMF